MKKFVNKVREAIDRASQPIAAPEFPDFPLASQTSWSPLQPGGSNFKTHTFNVIDDHHAGFSATIAARLFSMVFGGIGATIAVIGGGMLFFRGMESLPVGPVMVLFGLVFTGVGVYIYRVFDRTIIFDLTDGLFWRGKRPNLADSEQTPDTWCRIDEIAGIQVLREFVSSSKSSYYSYEINLVLKDASRRHVVDHGSLKQITNDAEQLGEFLQVPVWNGAFR